MDVLCEFPGQCAALKLSDGLAADIDFAEDIDRLKPRKLFTPTMACGSSSAEAFYPSVVGKEVAGRVLKVRYGQLHFVML
jgi:hypothetical protein